MREPKIDIDAVGGVDLERLGRSLLLHGERVGDGRYHVTGGEHDHWVDLYTTSHPRCDCGDHLWREQICKHILAALLREGHDRVVEALGPLFRRVQPERTRRDARVGPRTRASCRARSCRFDVHAASRSAAPR